MTSPGTVWAGSWMVRLRIYAGMQCCKEKSSNSWETACRAASRRPNHPSRALCPQPHPYSANFNNLLSVLDTFDLGTNQTKYQLLRPIEGAVLDKTEVFLQEQIMLNQ
jgi:hypothetical protein